MRPTTARRVVRRAIESYLRNESTKELYSVRTASALKTLDRVLRREFEKMECTYLETPITIPDDIDEESKRYDMAYYSDRFMAPHRLEWIIVGVNKKIF